VWAAAFQVFKWTKDMSIEHVFEGPLKDYRIEGTFHCRLCDQYGLHRGELEAHARHHKFEFAAWRAELRAQQELVV
jgi:hypothetical protein